MKINNITIVNGILTIEVDSTTDVTNILIDSLYNTSNMYSTDVTLHSFNVTNFETTATTIIVNIDQTIPNLDTTAFTVNIKGTVKFYYDKQELYYKQVLLVNTDCSSCLCNYKMDIIQSLLLKLYMLDYAEANSILPDEINLYIDISRILALDLNSNIQSIVNYTPNNCLPCLI